MATVEELGVFMWNYTVHGLAIGGVVGGVLAVLYVAQKVFVRS